MQSLVRSIILLYLGYEITHESLLWKSRVMMVGKKSGFGQNFITFG